MPIMTNFERVLRSSQMTEASEDRVWMESTREALLSYPDEYLVEMLRMTVMVSAMRLAGVDRPSIELTQHGMRQVIDLLKESVE